MTTPTKIAVGIGALLALLWSRRSAAAAAPPPPAPTAATPDPWTDGGPIAARLDYVPVYENADRSDDGYLLRRGSVATLLQHGIQAGTPPQDTLAITFADPAPDSFAHVSADGGTLYPPHDPPLTPGATYYTLAKGWQPNT